MSVTLERLAPPDIILPSQIDHSRPVEGIHALAAAIMHDVVKVATRYARAAALGHVSPHLIRQVNQDRAWINSTLIEPFSFIAVIEMLDGEPPEYWRRLVNDIYDGRLKIGRLARLSRNTGTYAASFAIRPARIRQRPAKVSV